MRSNGGYDMACRTARPNIDIVKEPILIDVVHDRPQGRVDRSFAKSGIDKDGLNISEGPMIHCELRRNPMMVHIRCLYAKTAHGAWLLASGSSFIHGNAKPHPRARPGGACPARQDAPGMVSCLYRQVQRPANRWWN